MFQTHLATPPGDVPARIRSRFIAYEQKTYGAVAVVMSSDLGLDAATLLNVHTVDWNAEEMVTSAFTAAVVQYMTQLDPVAHPGAYTQFIDATSTWNLHPVFIDITSLRPSTDGASVALTVDLSSNCMSSLNFALQCMSRARSSFACIAHPVIRRYTPANRLAEYAIGVAAAATVEAGAAVVRHVVSVRQHGGQQEAIA